ncbi:hypothetical protein [Burkholderia glumae]|uniref:hypothetical protein n=1 Tax=Burkholderia glumae TaxID=337 RepID=UPI0002F6DE2D|nr:hypothetical protein [Burkholderia glumae]
MNQGKRSNHAEQGKRNGERTAEPYANLQVIQGFHGLPPQCRQFPVLTDVPARKLRGAMKIHNAAAA